MSNIWDKVAIIRHNDLLNNKDKTFNLVFLPSILEILHSFENYNDFSVLDVGCGTGYLLHILSEETNNLHGIDSSEISVKIAQEFNKNKKNVSIMQAKVEDYYKDHSHRYNFIIAHMTLHTIESLPRALISINRLLIASGHFLFSIPHPCFWSTIKEEVGTDNFNYWSDSFHLNNFPFSDGSIAKTPHYHRSLSTYTSALLEANYVIERLFEPYPSPENMKLYSREWFSPGFLFVLCKKSSELENLS